MMPSDCPPSNIWVVGRLWVRFGKIKCAVLGRLEVGERSVLILVRVGILVLRFCRLIVGDVSLLGGVLTCCGFTSFAIPANCVLSAKVKYLRVERSYNSRKTSNSAKPLLAAVTSRLTIFFPAFDDTFHVTILHFLNHLFFLQTYVLFHDVQNHLF